MSEHEKVCPNCGHCPTCGRSNQWWGQWRFIPAYPWGPTYPYASWTGNTAGPNTGTITIQAINS